MKETIGDCPQNPHGKGHCDHTEHYTNTAGTHIVSRCCWCARTETVLMALPAHGTHAIGDKRHF